MVLADAEPMVPANDGPANLHVVTWPNPGAEAAGMARAIVDNIAAHPRDKHLVMVTRREFGYALRTAIAALNNQLKVDLSFSEGLLESWAAREAFLLFCLLVDPDRPTWRAWFAYRNSADGRSFKAPSRNAAAYLQMMDAAQDQITVPIVEALAQEPRAQQRGAGGAFLWDRASRFVELRNAFAIGEGADAVAVLRNIFSADHWIRDGYYEEASARLDLELLLAKAEALQADEAERVPDVPAADRLREVARRLRQHIATREPLNDEGDSDLQVCTLWGAKGVTADHVYVLGVCGEVIPGRRRPEYPGTEADYREEQRRLFYVSITRSKRTLVLSRALSIRRGEAVKLGLSVGPAGGRFWAQLQMSPFLRDILAVLPAAVQGDHWQGCV